MDARWKAVSRYSTLKLVRIYNIFLFNTFFFYISVWVQLLDRKQQRLELVLLSVDNFCEPPPNVYNSENHFTPSSASVQVIYSETNSIWINVNDLLYFLPSDDPTEVKFIWGSEETNYRHLCLITSSIAGILKALLKCCTF